MHTNEAMAQIKELATSTQLVKDSEGTGIEYTFKSEKDCSTALTSAYAAQLQVSGGSPKTFYVWH